MTRMKAAVVCLTALSIALPRAVAFADPPTPVTLDWCQARARERYPLVRQYGLIDEAERYSLHVALTGYFPRLGVSGKATDQSEVTHVSLSVPGVSIPSPSAFQYQAVAEASETLWDGNLEGVQRAIAKASATAERRKLDADVYALRDRVNQTYFGVLLFDAQLGQNDLLRGDLETNLARVASCVENGASPASDLDAIRVERLNAEQARVSLLAARSSYLAMLSRIVGETLGEDRALERPAELAGAGASLPAAGSLPAGATRPEYAAFGARESLLAAQKGLALAASQPRVAAFFQIGYGSPSLNMLSDAPGAFWLGGVRVSWALDSFYTLGDNLAKLDADIAGVAVQRELFRYGQDLERERQESEIARLRALLASDDEIIALRVSIKRAAEAKAEGGALPVGDLVRVINDENRARSTRSLREIQLLAVEYSLAFSDGE